MATGTFSYDAGDGTWRSIKTDGRTGVPLMGEAWRTIPAPAGRKSMNWQETAFTRPAGVKSGTATIERGRYWRIIPPDSLPGLLRIRAAKHAIGACEALGLEGVALHFVEPASATDADLTTPRDCSGADAWAMAGDGTKAIYIVRSKVDEDSIGRICAHEARHLYHAGWKDSPSFADSAEEADCDRWADAYIQDLEG
jgi:hypothetical protein